MKKISLLFSLTMLFCSCDILTPYRETKYVYFSLNNAGSSIYKNIIVYAKDASQSIVDSSSNIAYTPTDKNSPTVPNSKGIQVGIILSNLKDVENGVFEVQATMLSGKFLSKEFGVIDGLKTRQKFYVDLMDSTILVK